MKNHILVLDDEDFIRELLGEFLTDAGYRVTTVATVSAALKSARQEQPDLVISDLQLEDGDGLQMIDQLKTDYPDIPVILLTGVLFDHEVVDKVLVKKVDCYLEKTSPLSKIGETVQSLLPPPAES